MTIPNFFEPKENTGYQIPPKHIADLINAPLTPSIFIGPRKNWMLLMKRPTRPMIEELTKTELKLAGLRIHPDTHSQSRPYFYTGIQVQSIDGSLKKTVTGLPNQLHIRNMSWSPDGKKIAFTLTQANGLELWVLKLKTAKATKLSSPIINNTMSGLPFKWSPDSKGILAKTVCLDPTTLPQAPKVPKGPIIRENEGKKTPARTYQDLLKNPYDEALFEYYTTAQLKYFPLKGKAKNVGKPGIISYFMYAPSGKYLLVKTYQKPFSYLFQYDRFPHLIEVWDNKGTLVRQLENVPLADDIPITFGSVRKGPRNHGWRADAPNTLYWVTAQDDGDAEKEVATRDQLFFLSAPFNTPPIASFSTQYRFGDIDWCNGKLAVVNEWWWKSRLYKQSFFEPDNPTAPLQLIIERTWEDKYNDPGLFVTTTNHAGKSILLLADQGKSLYLKGKGASTEGNRPFLDKFDINSQQTQRLWRSEAPYYERIVRIMDSEKGKVLSAREAQDEVPNYFLKDLKSGQMTQITHFEHPYPQLKNVKKELIQYQRADGVQLNGNLYLPPGYEKGSQKLPLLLWAYPQEYKNANTTGQVRNSPYEFLHIGWWSPILWVLQGYAVLDDPTMPIVGEGTAEPNDTYVEQLVANAKAAIDTLTDMGITDPKRVAVGGHSYGAFMAANLLAHSNLFAAGIARSGAYNRTLTPFGFQSEERSLWQAPDTYIKMSPFMNVHRIKTPLLLIHGEADSNSGTYPMQSERLYNALKGLGATTRLVMLPYESHGYQAHESVMHTIWEMDRWLRKYV